MPNNCAAYGCNHRMSPETKERGITFHLLPPETDVRRKLWIANSRRIDPVTRRPWNPTSKYIYFCSEHFVTADFEYSAKAYSNRRLKDNAVPTVFTFPTTLPDSPENQSAIRSSQNIEDSATGDNSYMKSSSRRKLKHRKVVMLPKKIKQLQDASSDNMESVTIISFQHLDYDEKFQPMFEKAILDLQCPADSDYGEDDEDQEEQECYGNIEDEMGCTIPIQPKQLAASMYDPNEEYCQNEEEMEEEISAKRLKQDTGESNSVSEKEIENDVSCLEGSYVENHESQQGTEESVNNVSNSAVEEVNLDFEVEEGAKNEMVSPTNSSSSDMHDGNAFKKRVPVIIQELSVIRDFDELRKKAFRIAEDNINLKRQVTYLEKRLEEFVS